MSRRILRNSARCGNCRDHIVSKYLGDYQNCACGQLSVAGGPTQLIRHAQAGTAWTDTTMYEGNVEPDRSASDGEVARVDHDGSGGGDSGVGDVT